ncbi:hypothetical protein BJP62_02030 [Jeongeupia sp. USM3]|nr:hypothetical protein BJP62_02030 [Jeongeupia sp. USM3]
MRDKAATELTRLGDEIGACLDRLAVRIPPAVQLYSSADGRIVVGSEHAAKDAIEASLNGDTRVLKMFKEVEVLYDILRKAELRGTGRFESQHFNLGLTSLGCIAFFTESAES